MEKICNWFPICKYATAAPLINRCAWSSSGRQEVLQPPAEGGFDVRKGDRTKNLCMLSHFPINAHNQFVVMTDLFHC